MKKKVTANDVLGILAPKMKYERFKRLPYFQTQVVKVEKRKKCEHKFAPDMHTYLYNGTIKCPICGRGLTQEWLRNRTMEDIKKTKKQPKGNWVNGENLDKIKFPVPCSYVEEGKKHIGMLNCYVDQYRLYNIEKQSKDNFVDDCTSLKNLINSYDIHILKGKVILFEDDMEDKYSDE